METLKIDEQLDKIRFGSARSALFGVDACRG